MENRSDLRIRVIFNPSARGDRAPDPRRRLQDLDREAELAASSSLDDARELARRAAEEGVDVVAAAGGDGTVAAVANGLAGSETALAVLPLGTANVFAYEMGIPGGLRKAWDLIREGTIRRIDLGRATVADGRRRLFIQLAGVGLDARIVQDTTFDSKRLLGPLSYLMTGFRLMSETPPRVRVESDHHDPCEGMGVLIGNGAHYAGRFRIFRDAANDDGWLDACVFTGENLLDLLRYAQGVIRGGHGDLADVVFLRSRRFRMSSEDAVVETDGDFLGETPAEIEIVPGALRVVAPRDLPSHSRRLDFFGM